MRNYFLPNIWFYILLIASLCFIGIHPCHNKALINYQFDDNVRFIEMGLCFILFILFGVFVLSPNGKFYKFYSGNNNEYTIDNKFYSWLIFCAIQFVVFFIIHYLNFSNKSKEDIQQSMKIWEISAYLVTTIYTVWFWLNPKRGLDIMTNHLGDNKVLTIVSIVIANLVLIAIAVVHSVIYFGGTFLTESISHKLEENEIWLSLFLIFGVYLLFCYINVKVIKNTTNETTKKDFLTMYKYIDNPTRIIFGILLAFAFYTLAIGTLNSMEGFFSGAIAFELLLSSIVWANTETA